MSRLIPVLAVAALALAPASARAQKGLRPAAGSLVPHDVNQVFLRVSNRGGYGLQLEPVDVGNFPRGSPNRYLFGAGLWVGGIGDVDADGSPDSITTIGFRTEAGGGPAIEWIEGALGFNPDDPIFRVLDTTVPADRTNFPGEPVADQELFTIYSDRVSLFGQTQPSIPLGVEVRQRSFAFTDPELASAVFFQYDLTNISDRIRATGYTIGDLWTAIVLDPDIGREQGVLDDTAAPLEIDGEEVLLIWDSDFQEPGYEGAPGFLAVFPLVNPGGRMHITQLRSPSSGRLDVLPVPLSDATQYETLSATPPRLPTIGPPGFDLRAMVSWGAIDLVPGETFRTAAAFVWAAPTGTPPATLSPVDPGPTEDTPVLAGLVAAVRAAREAYASRLQGLPALLDFPGDPPEPGPAEGDAVLQNVPNPFRDQTSIEVHVGSAGPASVRVFDLSGREVERLAEGQREAGSFRVTWDGRSQAGEEVPAGVYVVRLETSRGTASIRVLKAP